MKRFLIYSFFLLAFTACKKEIKPINNNVTTAKDHPLEKHATEIDYYSLFKNNKTYVSNGFDFPVGKPHSKGYYKAQKFGGECDFCLEMSLRIL